MEILDRQPPHKRKSPKTILRYLSVVFFTCIILAFSVQIANAEDIDPLTEENTGSDNTSEEISPVDVGVLDPSSPNESELVLNSTTPIDEVLDSNSLSLSDLPLPSDEPTGIYSSPDSSEAPVSPEDSQPLEEFSEDEDDLTPSDETASSDSCLVSEVTEPSEGISPSEDESGSELPATPEQDQISEESSLIDDNAVSEVLTTAEPSSSSENEMDSETTEAPSDINPQDAETNDGSELIEQTTSDGSAEESEAPAISEPSSSSENEVDSETTEVSSDTDPQDAEDNDGSEPSKETPSDKLDLEVSELDSADPADMPAIVEKAPDPYFTRNDIKYSFIETGCNINDPYCIEVSNPIQAAIDDVKAGGMPDDGIIYVEAGLFEDPFTICDFSVPLTLQGDPAGGSILSGEGQKTQDPKS